MVWMFWPVGVERGNDAVYTFCDLGIRPRRVLFTAGSRDPDCWASWEMGLPSWPGGWMWTVICAGGWGGVSALSERLVPRVLCSKTGDEAWETVGDARSLGLLALLRVRPRPRLPVGLGESGGETEDWWLSGAAARGPSAGMGMGESDADTSGGMADFVSNVGVPDWPVNGCCCLNSGAEKSDLCCCCLDDFLRRGGETESLYASSLSDWSWPWLLESCTRTISSSSSSTISSGRSLPVSSRRLIMSSSI